MVKRQKWIKKEDKALKAFVEMEKGILKWDVISHQMGEMGIRKSAKQCRERWLHQINPELIKNKWTEKENRLLMKLQKEHGNSWKVVAEHFKGRTDNSIKNNFFSIVRKSLRNACKILGKISNTKRINNIKPKVLVDYINRNVRINKNELSNSEIEIKSSFNEKIDSENSLIIINLMEFIEKFAFNKFVKIYSEINDRDKLIIQKCIDYLFTLNADYSTTNNKKIKKTKSVNSPVQNKMKDSIISQNEQNKKQLIISKISINNINYTENRLSTNNQININNSNDINNLTLNLKNHMEKEIDLKVKYQKNPLELKKKLIEHYEELNKINDQILKVIWMASEQEIINYSRTHDVDIVDKIRENFQKKKDNKFFNERMESEIIIPENKKSSKNSLCSLNKKNDLFSFSNVFGTNSNMMINSKMSNNDELKQKIMDVFLESNLSEGLNKSNNDLFVNLQQSGYDPIFGKVKKQNFDNIFDNLQQSNFQQSNSNFDPIFGELRNSCSFKKM